MQTVIPGDTISYFESMWITTVGNEDCNELLSGIMVSAVERKASSGAEMIFDSMVRLLFWAYMR